MSKTMRDYLRIAIITVFLVVGIPMAVLTVWYELTVPPIARLGSR